MAGRSRGADRGRGRDRDRQNEDLKRKLGLLPFPDGDGGGYDDGDGDDGDLEAELAALVGGTEGRAKKEKPRGKGVTPGALEEIARMAAVCMRDDDDGDDGDDGDLEMDMELLAELQEVMEDVETEAPVSKPQPQPQAVIPTHSQPMVSLLESRVSLYAEAVSNARLAGESSKARRFERGLKSCQDLLKAAKSGRSISEEDIPPPVATGNKTREAKPEPDPKPEVKPEQKPEVRPKPEVKPKPEVAPKPEVKPPPAVKPEVSPEQKPEVRPKPEVQAKPKMSPEPELKPKPGTEQKREPEPGNRSGSEDPSPLLLDLRQRQREYSVAALAAKKHGDTETAMAYFRTAKSFDAVISALLRGERVDLSNAPPPPAAPAAAAPSPAVPVNVAPSPKVGGPEPQTKPPPSLPDTPLSALEARLSAYRDIAAQAKKEGNSAKARRHERIATSYVDAIKALKAGKPVDFSELPALPSFPPIPGVVGSGGEDAVVASLASLDRHGDLQSAEMETGESGQRSGEKMERAPAATRSVAPPTTPQPVPGPTQSVPGPTQPVTKSPAACQQQLQLRLLQRRRTLLHAAALRCKESGDLAGAKVLLKQRRGVDAFLEHCQAGMPVDIAQIPAPPPLPDSDFEFVSRREARDSERHHEEYSRLGHVLRAQHSKCQEIAQQFTLLGNITEIAKYEAMEDEVATQLEFLRKAHSLGLPPPKSHQEKRTMRAIRINAHLSALEMELLIVKGINLPAPSGYSQGDLNSFIKFEFPFPTSDQPQTDKTQSVKNSCNPVYNAEFKLSIVRTNRTFRRAISSKGIRLELYHKRLLKSDLVAWASFRLEKLETQSHVRAILEMMDGRKPTGGKLEVVARLREPLAGPEFYLSTENWLSVEVVNIAPVTVPKSLPPAAKSVPVRMWSLEVLGLEKKLCDAQMAGFRDRGQPLPPALGDVAARISQRAERQRHFLRSGGPAARRDYTAFLKNEYSRYSQEAKKYHQSGDKEKEHKAIERGRLIQKELHAFQD
ncbi:coiled-coil and C2 domain-containing protein 1A-like isoform X1 [Lethenteron reissneri]|uniref:coiled-coil and C2 domain-containing protein 1A-like isoform X1 n=2 Tax=Lethenteron reissneri TaxID=7753 RepID=UPI002AB7AE19|nr:coiled-coil and C2 domain-containing protein 1A-like isoform X1 [Lethenteron reissneri]